MKLGVKVIHSKEATIDEQFATLEKNGFRFCQLDSWIPELWTDEEAENIKRASAAHNITITAFWCGWEGPAIWDFYDGPETLGILPLTWRYARIKNICDGADFALKLGITDVATHMGFIPENPRDPNYAGFLNATRVIADHLKENNQYLLFETGQETPVAMLRIFEDSGCENLGVNLDTANLILYGKANPVDALDVFGKYVRNLHAKDGLYPTNGHDLGKEVRIGEGKVDFPKLFARLKELGYDGPVTIEREITGEEQLKDIMDAKEYLEKTINEVYGG